MIKLSNRLKSIADKTFGARKIADIGTDHGKLPIYLLKENLVNKAILCDINSGPLDIALENIKKHDLEASNYEIRKGNGLEPIFENEVDCVVIAGMGGILISEIIGANLEKSRSIKKFILQPRNFENLLRKWLTENDFYIADEELVSERKFICQIITLDMNQSYYDSKSSISKLQFGLKLIENIELWQYEVSPILFQKKDILLPEFIKRKISIEKKIMKEFSKSKEVSSQILIEKSIRRIEILEDLKILAISIITED